MVLDSLQIYWRTFRYYSYLYINASVNFLVIPLVKKKCLGEVTIASVGIKRRVVSALCFKYFLFMYVFS